MKNSIMDVLKGVNNNVSITKVETKYVLNYLGDKNCRLYASVHDSGNISLTTAGNKDNFIFKNTTPAMIEKIAELILEASKLK